jgi:hypothetical protein
MTLVRVPEWGCEIARADYYGWCYGLHLGPWLLFFWKATP